MKRLLVIAVLALAPVLLFSGSQETDDAIEALAGTIDLSEWDRWFEAEGYDADFTPSRYLDAIIRMQEPDPSHGIGSRLKDLLLPGLKSAAVMLTVLIGLAVCSAAIGGLSDASAMAEPAKITLRVVTACAVLVTAASGIRTASGAVRLIFRTTELTLPAIVGFLALGGMEHTAALLTASRELLSGTVLYLLETCVVPLAAVGGVLYALDACGTGRLASIGRLLHRAAKWILGTTCSLFLLFTAIRGAAAGGADGLLLKTTKLMAGSVPAVGGVLSESVDAAFRCLQFVKNALGLTGTVLILLIAAKPVLSVFWTRCALRAASMLADPLSGKPYADLLRGMGDTLHLLLLAELAAVAMSLLVIAPVLGAGRIA